MCVYVCGCDAWKGGVIHGKEGRQNLSGARKVVLLVRHLILCGAAHARGNENSRRVRNLHKAQVVELLEVVPVQRAPAVLLGAQSFEPFDLARWDIAEHVLHHLDPALRAVREHQEDIKRRV